MATQTVILVDQTFNVTYADDDFPLNASSNNPGQFYYSSDAPSVVVVNDYGIVSIRGVGSAVITITQNARSTSPQYTSGIATTTIHVTAKTTQLTVPEEIDTIYGVPNVRLSAISTSAMPFQFTSSNTDIVSINPSGFITALKYGTVTITTTQQEGGGYTSASRTTIVNVQRQTTVINHSIINQQYGFAPFPLIDYISSNSSASFVFTAEYPLDNSVNPPKSVELIDVSQDGIVSIKQNSDYKVGTAVVRIEQAETDGYTSAKIYQSIVIGSIPTTIGVSAEIIKNIEDPPFQLNVTTNGENRVITYTSSDPSVATINSSGLITLIGMGQTIIKTTVQPTLTYTDATANTLLTVVGPQTQTVIDVSGSLVKTYGDFSFYLTPTSNSNMPFQFASSDNTIATVTNAGLVTLLKSGDVVITTSQQSNIFFTSGTANTNISIAKQTTVISASASSFSKTYGDAPFSLNATTNNVDTPLTYVSSNVNVATVSSNGIVTIVGVGTAFISISQQTSDRYTNGAIIVSVSVVKKTATINVPQLIRKNLLTDPFNINANSLNPEPFTYTSSDVSVATISEAGVITIQGIEGTTVITTSQPSNANFNSNSATTTLEVVDAIEPVIIVPSTVTKVYGDAPFELHATSESTADFTYVSSNEQVAVVSANGVVTLVGVGSATITTSQAEIPGYLDASANTIVNVSASTPDNPVPLDNGEQLEYFLSTDATYATITTNLVITNNLINTSNSSKILINTSGTFKQMFKQIQQQLIVSKNNTTSGGFTVGGLVDKDMDTDDYDYELTPSEYPELFLNMEPLISENIVQGDKHEDNILLSCYWDDLDDDVFDDWGFFYIYDVNTGKYYFPLFEPMNLEDGVITTQTFNVFGKTYTIKHGWCVQGIFKFEISCNDNSPFRFGGYGNMGSDGDENIENKTHPYTIGSTNLTLYYNKHAEIGDNNEILYTYVVPMNINENASQTYNIYNDDGDYMSLMTKEVTTGVTLYFAKKNDVKEWIVNDLAII